MQYVTLSFLCGLVLNRALSLYPVFGMSHKVSIANLEGPYHVTIRCINREWFSIPMDSVWEIFCNQIYFCQRAFDLKIHSFVLMSNHYHLLVSTPQLNLSQAMAYLNRECSRDLNRLGNRINRTFAGRYNKSYLGSYHYFLNCYKYVYQNPLRANLVSRVENYKYSTLGGLLGSYPMLVPLVEDTILFEGDLQETLTWLNKAPEDRDLESIRNGLKHGRFQLRRDIMTRHQNRLEVELL